MRACVRVCVQTTVLYVVPAVADGQGAWGRGQVSQRYTAGVVSGGWMSDIAIYLQAGFCVSACIWCICVYISVPMRVQVRGLDVCMWMCAFVPMGGDGRW